MSRLRVITDGTIGGTRIEGLPDGTYPRDIELRLTPIGFEARLTLRPVDVEVEISSALYAVTDVPDELVEAVVGQEVPSAAVTLRERQETPPGPPVPPRIPGHLGTPAVPKEHNLRVLRTCSLTLRRSLTQEGKLVLDPRGFDHCEACSRFKEAVDEGGVPAGRYEVWLSRPETMAYRMVVAA